MTWGGNDMLWSSRGTPADEVAPTISTPSPAPGNVESGQAITFDVEDETLLADVKVWLVQANGATEMIFDGDNFTADYAGSSTRTPIANGFTFSVRRTGGWPSGTWRLAVDGTDTGGNRP